MAFAARQTTGGSLRAQESAQAEFLVEGLKEGTREIGFTIRAILDGLPSGPMNISGRARGAVLVRNPTFALAFSHPNVLRSGVTYDLHGPVVNTSQTIANLLSVNLDPAALSCATIFSENRVEFDTILPDDLVTHADNLLGLAYCLATAPAGSLPPSLPSLSVNAIEKGRELAEAGIRLGLLEPRAQVLADLAFDFLRDPEAARGFDRIRRGATSGRLFADTLATAPNADQSKTVTVVDNTDTTITVDPADGDMTAVCAPGDPHVGVIFLDKLSLTNGADVETGDDIHLSAGSTLTVHDSTLRANRIVGTGYVTDVVTGTIEVK